MVVVFGWGGGDTQDRGEVVEVRCPTCHNDVYLHAIRTTKEVSLYFIPLVPYGSDEYLACPICQHGLRIGPQHAGAVGAMIGSTGLWRSGAISADDYRARIDWFWNAMGRPAGFADGPPIGSPEGGAPAIEPSAAAASTAPPATTTDGPNLAEQIGALASLRDQGLLTDDEFAKAKARLLET